MKQLLSVFYPYLFLFFCFVIPLDKYAAAVPNIVLIALLVIFSFVVKKDDFKKLLKLEILIFTGLVVYLVINNLLFHDYTSDFSILKKIGSSLLLIVLFIPLNKTIKLKKTIILSVLTCILISLVNIYWFYLNEGEFNFASGAAINEVLVIDRLYLGFLSVISITVSFGLINQKYNDFNKWYFANIVINIGFILLISSRIAVLLLLVLFFLKIFYSKNRTHYIYFFTGIITIIIIAFSLNKNLQERFFYTQSSGSNKSYIELFKAWEPRVVIWACNYSITKEEDVFFKGLGFYKTKDLLVDCYNSDIKKEDKRIYFVNSRFNSHNQFIDFFLSSGIIGFLLFASIFSLLFFKNKNSYFKTALFISIFTFIFIENIFHRQLGAYYFGIIMILLLFNDDKTERKPKTID